MTVCLVSLQVIQLSCLIIIIIKLQSYNYIEALQFLFLVAEKKLILSSNYPH